MSWKIYNRKLKAYIDHSFENKNLELKPLNPLIADQDFHKRSWVYGFHFNTIEDAVSEIDKLIVNGCPPEHLELIECSSRDIHPKVRIVRLK